MKISKFKKHSINFSNFIYQNFRKSLKQIRMAKSYIIFSVILFLFFIILGYFFPIFFKQEILRLIKELLDKTKGLNLINLILFIFKNNFKTSFLGMILGIFFGLFPLIILIINGYLLGFVISKALIGFNLISLWRLFPHGIFEIPAVIISLSFGLMLGVYSIIFIINFIKNYKGKIPKIILIILFLFSPIIFLLATYFFSKNKEQVKELNMQIINSLRVFFMIVLPLLIIAAIIEGVLILLI